MWDEEKDARRLRSVPGGFSTEHIGRWLFEKSFLNSKRSQQSYFETGGIDRLNTGVP